MHVTAPCLLLLGLGALPGCGKEAGSHPTPIDAASSATATSPALSPEERERLKDEVRRSLKAELHDEVVAELKRELAPEVRAQLVADSRSASAAADAVAAPDVPVVPSAPTAPDATPSPSPDATAATTEGDAKPGDIWSTPGTKIWPSAGGLRLVELEVGTALEDKLPTDVRTHYATAPDILYCYTVFENPLPDATVTHVWRRGTRLVSRVELEVGTSPKWRTWSKQRTQPNWTGLWSCEVLGEDGRQLGLTVFQVGG